jgi:vancomycin resistance protein VanJ
MPNHPKKWRRWLRRVLLLSINLYGIGLTLYLILRYTRGDKSWWLAFLHSFAPFYFLPLLFCLPVVVRLRAWRSLVLLLLLLGFGLGRYGPRFMPKAQAASDMETLRVVTFNVWGRNRDLRLLEDWLLSIDADVVFLQELPLDYENTRFEVLRGVYPYYVSEQDSTRDDTANLILSRYPVNTSEYGLRSDGIPIPQRALLNYQGEQIALYNFHGASPERYRRSPLRRFLYGDYMKMAFDYNEELRNAQIRELIYQTQRESLPFIVAGDFNTSDHAAMYDFIASHWRDSFAQSGYGLGASWPVAHARGLPAFIPPLVRLDYIWHSPNLRTVSAGQGPFLGSDHLPVTATLEIHPGKGL